MSRLSVSLLGPPRIELEGRSVRFDTRKTSALLFYLAVSKQTLRRDSLVSLLWPESGESSGRSLLRGSLHVLRRELGSEWIRANRDTVALNADLDPWIDVQEFSDLLAECESHGHGADEFCPSCREPLSKALDLYRGVFLEGFSLKDSVSFDDWQTLQTQKLHSEMTSGFDRLIGCLKESGDLPKAVGYAQRWLELDPVAEQAHRHLMGLYARSGQRNAALSQFEKCVRLLKNELGISPEEETLRLVEAIREDHIQPVSQRLHEAASPPPNNLPRQLTSFIGRENEIRSITSISKSTSLLTLTGPGGCGKTRLALEVAAEVMPYYSDGLWFVELASLSDSAFLEQTVASTLGITDHSDQPPIRTLVDYLKSKKALLLLDNCEHLVHACGRLCTMLLQNCTLLRIVATSREPLHIVGEREFLVPPLSRRPKQISQILICFPASR